MAVTDVSSSPILAVSATSSATSAPSSGTDGYRLKPGKPGMKTIRTLFAYSGTVNAASVRLWVRDVGSATWYRGASTDDLRPHAPGGSGPVAESRDWEVGNNSECFFQVASISGGGTIAIKLMGVSA